MARKSIEEIAAASAGQTSEESPHKNPGGVYEYARPDGTVVTLIARESERFGTPQADAAVRVGYVYVRPATVEELSVPDFIPGPTKQQLAAMPQGYSEPMVPKAQLDALEARLAALETVPAAPVEEAKVAEEVPVTNPETTKK